MVNFSKVFSTALSNLLSRPILLILMSFFIIIVIAELEYIDDKPITWLSKNINETNFGGKFLKKVVDKIEANLYILTLAYGLLVLGIFINGVRYLFFIHIIIIAVLASINISKEIFVSASILIIIEYLYFVIKVFIIRIILLIVFIGSFYIEIEFKTITNNNVPGRNNPNRIPTTTSKTL